MSKEVSIFASSNNVVISGERKLSKLAQTLAASSMMRRIQTNTNGTFKRLVNGEQVGNAVRGELDVIIVGALPQVSRVYYAQKYDPNAEPTAPNCWSNLGEAPEKGASDPQHSNCADCPMNVKGSGENGGKACRYQRRISLLVAGDPSGDIYQFNIPSKSLFGKGSGNVHPFESYIKFLIANGESPDNVVTKISYDDNADSMELLFSPVRNISDAEYAMVVAAQARPEAEGYTKITVSQVDGVTKAPPKAEPVKEAPKPKVIRTEDPDDDAPAPAPAQTKAKAPAAAPAEPVKRERKRESAPAPAADVDIGSVLSEWGSDD
jgi:hypothetical protein